MAADAVDSRQTLARSQPLMLPAPTPAIDIVVPIHNAADDLRRCVESVVAHTDGDYRLLLIDDASTDLEVRAYLRELETKRLPSAIIWDKS